jgi:hypothetical protein
MMNRLRTLFFPVLTNKGNHLLSLTKDQDQLDQYFYQKLNILAGYYHILDWNFCER